MTLSRTALPLALVLVAGLFGPTACSCGSDTSGFGGGGNGGSGANGTGASGQGGLLGFGGSGGGSGLKQGCSPDLQSVVNEQGAVVKQCPPDQGCFGGECIVACDAAAQSKGTIGCDFWAPDPPFVGNGPNSPWSGLPLQGPCYAVFLANTWSRSAKLTIERGGQTFDVTTFGKIPKGIFPNITYDPVPADGLPPNEVAVLFLSHKPGVANSTSLECPVQPAILDDAAVQGSGSGAAFHVTSDTPVSSYDILPYGGASSYLPSATLLFPSTAWGTNYYAVSPHPESGGDLWMMIVGAQDGTKVKVAPTVTLPGGGAVGPANAGQTNEFTVNKGEILQWLGADPTSAVVESDKPVGVWTGNTYLRVTSLTNASGGGEDSAHQELAHVKALGSEYVGGSVVTRLTSLAPESTPYRIMGVVDGTQLSWDPAPPGAPTTIDAGQVVELESTSVFVVRSQDENHPFALTQYMTGTMPEGTRPGCNAQYASFCNLGDEEWVHLLSPKQFLQRYVFFTDPTYPTTNLVVVRVKGESGFSDVDVACLGTITGWQPVGSSGQYEYAHVDLVRSGTPVANCNVSRHEAKSAGQFGIVVWGTDWYSSYGYPAGGNVGTINDVVVPPDPK